MSKQPQDNPRSFWPLVNAITAPLAFLIIGYVVWAAINAKPRVIPVASAPTFIVIDPNVSDEQNVSKQELSSDKTEVPIVDPDANDEQDASKGAQEGAPSIAGSESKETTVTSEPVPLSGKGIDGSSTGNADAGESVPTAKETDLPPDAPKQPEPTVEPVPEPASDPKPTPEPNPAKPKVALGPKPNFYNVAVAKFLFEKKCSECHKLERVKNHEFADVTAVEEMIDKMVENGLEVNEKERAFLDYYVQSTFID